MSAQRTKPRNYVKVSRANQQNLWNGVSKFTSNMLLNYASVILFDVSTLVILFCNLFSECMAPANESLSRYDGGDRLERIGRGPLQSDSAIGHMSESPQCLY